MHTYLQEIYRDHVIVFTEMKHFYVYKIDITEQPQVDEQ